MSHPCCIALRQTRGRIARSASKPGATTPDVQQYALDCNRWSRAESTRLYHVAACRRPLHDFRWLRSRPTVLESGARSASRCARGREVHAGTSCQCLGAVAIEVLFDRLVLVGAHGTTGSCPPKWRHQSPRLRVLWCGEDCGPPTKPSQEGVNWPSSDRGLGLLRRPNAR